MEVSILKVLRMRAQNSLSHFLQVFQKFQKGSLELENTSLATLHQLWSGQYQISLRLIFVITRILKGTHTCNSIVIDVIYDLDRK